MTERRLRHARGTAENLRIFARACWNLRLLGLLLVGPLSGVVLAGDIFGLTSALYWTAGFFLVFTLSLFAILVRAEWSRLSIGSTP